ncbi:hypothetical protein [Streptomyces violaceusniger]|uniref:hypothetical protein n=1 Tax=Streptomyces violaceusniger TaxID=68280 RepID=UPI0002D398D4|nr:hypothetical protein [Streptomyces violaceusniger]
MRRKPQSGTVDDAVVEAMRKAIKEGEDDSTRTGTYIIWRTGEILREKGETAGLPSRATLCRLLAKLSQGSPVSGTARDRRSRAHGAKAPFGQWTVFAPGEVVQIDSTPLDVLVRLDDGGVGKVELNWHGRCHDQDGDRSGAAAHHEGGRHKRAAGPHGHPGTDAAGPGRRPADVAIGAAAPAAAGHR